MESIINSIFTNILSIFKPEAGTKELTNNDESIFSCDTKDTKIIAHRGDSDDAPENTLPAFVSAVENGYEVAECDVQWTKDDIPVLMHDKYINRTARTKKGFLLIIPRKCYNLNFEELKKFDFGGWFNKKFDDTEITTFEETLNYAKENNLELYIDLKETKNFNSKKAQILTQMVKDADMENNVSWISFNSQYLKEISNLLPNARLGYLSKKEITDKTINTLDELKTNSNEVFLDIKYTKITQEGLEKIKNSPYTYEAWTVDDIDKAKELIDEGFEGITTNNIEPNAIK